MSIITKISLFFVLMIPCHAAHGVEGRLIWEKYISNIYICSDSTAFSARALRDFYSSVLKKGEEMQFSDGWSGIQIPGKSLIISSSTSVFSEKVRNCLRSIPILSPDWLGEIEHQARSFEHLPAFLTRDSRNDALTSPMITWIFKRDGDVLLSSLIYTPKDKLSIREHIEGSIQFDAGMQTGIGNE